MANTQILIKKSGSPGTSPDSLQHGELGINYNDGKLYYKNSSNTISSIFTANSYSIISANSSLLISSSPSEILTINPSGAVVITTDTFSNIINIGVRQGSISQNGVVQLYSGTNSNLETLAATANSVNTVYQIATNALETANNSNATNILLTANNTYSGNVFVSWSFSSSGYDTLQTSSKLIYNPAKGKLSSKGFASTGGLIEHTNIISEDYIINDGYNAISGGPISIADNVTVTIPSGSSWTII